MAASKRNIVLTGFMGTGKSAVGRGVARRLGRAFVDMDEVIIQRAGMSIAEIFRQHGEETFRRHERALCEELSVQEGLVIATGGGALVDPHNRELMAASGYLICLDCEAEELFRRLEGDDSRPMLWDENPKQRLVELYRARRPAYAEISYHLDTTSRNPDETIAETIRLVEASPVAWRVATPLGSYPVQLIAGGLAYLGDLLRAREVGANIALVTDEHVWPLYGQALLESLRHHRLVPTAVVLPPGERFKTLDSVRILYDRFAEAGLDRGAAVIALGGGVITDMAGFVAATFMRGVPLVMVPTTLLGMVDASIGGKVAVDHPKGKNLIGAFVQPLLVLLDPQTLETLPEIERRAGLAEVIKAGIIADRELFECLESGVAADELSWMVQRAIAVKIAVVEEDPYEQGRRAVLNLGHTFAHAFEVLAGYQLHHGLAVSIGLAAAAHLAEIRGLCAPQTRERIVATLRRHNLPTSYDAHPPDVVYRAMFADKKRCGAKLRFVLPREVGEVVIDGDVLEDQVLTALERIR
ncbi:MAG: 3-dehydroquinate synthase, partial [Chloroflexi bacterium]|nr:3-dehydroquinate synthase [Chloroflexota bacterium]